MTPNSTHCPDWATALLHGFSQIFLQRHALCGVLCLLAVLCSAPALLGGALLGGVAGLLTAQRRGYPKAEREAGLYSYNGVLLGLLLPQVLPWSVLLVPLIIAGGGLSAMLVRQWLKRAPNPTCLPAYTAPFIALGWLLLSTAELPAAAPLAALPVNGMSLLLALFKGLGQVMLLEAPLAGVLIGAGLLLANRHAAAWALLGAALGLGAGLLLDAPQPGLAGPVQLQPGPGRPGAEPATAPALVAPAGHCPGDRPRSGLCRHRPGRPDGAFRPRLLAGARRHPSAATGRPRLRALRNPGQST